MALTPASGGRDGHGRVQRRPGGDADDIEMLLFQHLVIVQIDRVAAVLGLECLGIFHVDIGQRHNLGVCRSLIPHGVLVRHPIARRAVRVQRPPAANDADPVFAHAIFLLIDA